MEPRSLGKRRHVARAGVATSARQTAAGAVESAADSGAAQGPWKIWQWRTIGSQTLPLDAVKPGHAAG
jgi:hypothetical protein